MTCKPFGMKSARRTQASAGAIASFNATAIGLQQPRPAVLTQRTARTSIYLPCASYFETIADIEEKYGGIIAAQIWNMDEKGIQLGGGRKDGRKKFLNLEEKRQNRYKLHSDNLELVTVLECVSAAGEVAVPTSFVRLDEGPYPDIRGVENGPRTGLALKA